MIFKDKNIFKNKTLRMSLDEQNKVENHILEARLQLGVVALRLETFFLFISTKFKIDISKVKDVCLNKKEMSLNDFFEFVSKNYKIDISKIKDLYNETILKNKTTLNKKSTLTKKEQNAFDKATMICATNPELSKTISKYTETVASLKQKCLAKGLKVSGTKEELIQRITNPSITDLAKNITRKKKILFKTEGASKIITKMRGTLANRAIRKNGEGHYVDLESQLVFHPISKKAYAKWENDILISLKKEDIRFCIDNKFEYILPENLDNGKVDDKIVEEILGGDDFKDEESEEDDEFDEDDEEEI